MNLKQILIVSIILTILTIGAVSASDDLISDDDLTVNNEDDSIVEIDESTENDLVSADNNENVIGDDDYYDDDDYYCRVSDSVYLNDGDYVAYFNSYDSEVTGTLRAYVNNAVKFTKPITSADYDDGEFECYISPEDLEITSSGYYYVKVTLDDEFLDDNEVHAFDYYFSIDIDEYVYSGDDITGWIYLPSDITNGVTITANGKSYDVNNFEDGEARFSISSAGWNLGDHEVIFTYNGDNKYHAETIKETVEIEPKVYYPYYISLGEQDCISISAPSGNGNAVIYIYNETEGDYELFANFPISNGYGSYSLANLPKGEYDFKIDYNFGSYSSNIYVYMDVIDNNPNYSSSISSTEIINGNDVVVTLTGPSSSQKVYIYLDDNEFKSVSLANGKINEIISGLAVGTHKIRVFLDDDDFYSKTYYVTVKSAPSPAPAPAPKVTKKATKITAKKATFKAKKKTKKYTITLKSGKKAVKKVKVTLKVGKKTYKATTNSKGKATFKITKLNKKGKYTAVIKFKGNKTYKATSKKVKIKVKK